MHSQAAVAPAQTMNVTAEIARYVSRLRYEDIPPEAIAAAKRFMLDTLAVAWAGTSEGGCGPAREVLLREHGRGETTVWGWGDRVPA